MINNRYKTMSCRHWEQTGLCQMGARCHFAHGKEELRQMNDPLPTPAEPKTFSPSGGIGGPGGPGPQGVAAAGAMGGGMPYSNYKTVKCKYFDQGLCKFGESCSFAHGEEDMRNFQENAASGSFNMASMGGNMGSYGQYAMMANQQYYYTELNKKVVQMQLNYIISTFNQIKGNDMIKQKTKLATDLLSANNLNDCITILNEIIYNPVASNEEKEIFQKVLAEVQVIGSQYYAQLMASGGGSNQFPGGMPTNK